MRHVSQSRNNTSNILSGNSTQAFKKISCCRQKSGFRVSRQAILAICRAACTLRRRNSKTHLYFYSPGRHENEDFRKRSWNRRNLRTPAFRFSCARQTIWKRNFSRTLFKPEEFQNAGFPFFVCKANMLKTEVSENDGVTVILRF